MKIGIHLPPHFPHGGGIAKYASGLVRGLSQVDPKNRYVLFCSGDPPEGLPGNFAHHRIPARAQTLTTLMRAPRWIGAEGISLYHATSNLDLPSRKDCALVLTVHDLAAMGNPEWVPTKHRYLFKLLIKRNIKMADAVITVSNHSRGEILERFPWASSKVHVIPESHYVAADRAEGDPVHDADSPTDHPSPYLLFVGVIQPRKNLSTLLRAFPLIREAAGHVEGLKLMVVGSYGWKSEVLFHMVKDMGLEKEVTFRGHVPERELSRLYAGAEVFILPSLHEGFGIPVLEAMAHGVPVACSRAAALPEVAGGAAIYFDPLDAEEMAAAVTALLKDKELKEKMILKGRERVKRFSWVETARRTIAIYNSLS